MNYAYKAKDYSYSQMQDFESYRGCFDLDNETIEFDTGLDEYKNSDYVLNSHVLNRISDDVNNVQDAWENNVLGVLSDSYDEFQSRIDGLSNIKIWRSGASNVYKKNCIVVTEPNDGAYYLCLQDCDGTISLPSNTNNYWVKFYVKGDQGDNSWQLNFVGAFDWEATTYSINDVVYVDNSREVKFYVCISDVNYSTYTDISTDTTHWTLMFNIQKNRFFIEHNWETLILILPSIIHYPYNQIFGYVSNRNLHLIKIVDGKNSESIPNLKYMDLRTSMNQVMINEEPSNIYVRTLLEKYNL